MSCVVSDTSRNNGELTVVSHEEVTACQPTVVLVSSELLHQVSNGPVLQELTKSLCLVLSLLSGSCNELDSDLGSW